MLLLSKIGILKLMDGSTYSNSDPRAIAIKKAALPWAREIRYWFRLNIKPEQTPVEICNKLIRKFGVKAVAIARPGRRGQQKNLIYQVDGLDEPSIKLIVSRIREMRNDGSFNPPQ